MKWLLFLLLVLGLFTLGCVGDFLSNNSYNELNVTSCGHDKECFKASIKLCEPVKLRLNQTDEYFNSPNLTENLSSSTCEINLNHILHPHIGTKGWIACDITKVKNQLNCTLTEPT